MFPRRSSFTVRVFGATTLLAVLAAAGCRKQAAADQATEGDETRVAVQAEHPTVGPIAEEITADAILAPLAQAALSPRISAPITAEYVERGDHVHKGQLLLTLESRDLNGAALDSRGNLAQAQAAYNAATQATLPEDLQKAQLDVDQAKANLEVAQRTATERKRLLQEGAIAGRETDTAIAAAIQAQATYDTAIKHLSGVQQVTRKTGLETAQGQLTSARGRLVNAEAQVGYAQLRSPIRGVVTDRPLFPGETAAAGASVITVMDTSSLLAKLHLAQAAAQKLRTGGDASIQVPGEERPRSSVIAFISPALDPGSTTVEVWLKIDNRAGELKPGTPVHAVLHGTTLPSSMQVPAAAILPAEDGQTAVLIVGKDGAVHKRTVEIGLRAGQAVQILQGLAMVDLVVTEGGYGLDDGTSVQIQAADTTEGAADPASANHDGKSGKKQ